MKTKMILVFVSLWLAFTSCEKDNDYQLVNVATPKYMTLDELRTSVKITDPIAIRESGKIYAYNDLILINDVDKGIHIIDNSNPENPQKIAFIEVVASKDMEIKGDYLYVDSLMDLLVFDISDINNIALVSRLKDVFPSYIIIPFTEDLIIDYGEYNNTNGIIVSWDIKQEYKTLEEINELNNSIPIDIFNDIALASEASTTGQGGSLARFKIVENYLYAVDSHSINVFNIKKLESPQVLQSVYAGFDIETIFNKGENLFLGSMSGMYVYNISSPATPQFVSEFQHGTACDPVVVDDQYAYITLRAGNMCGALDSSLQIVDITDLSNLKLKKSYEMDNPYGLGIKNDLLFICDGTSGLKVYNKENVEELKLLHHFRDINTYDVIPLKEHLLMIGGNTLYQYKYENDSITLLSQFSLN